MLVVCVNGARIEITPSLLAEFAELAMRVRRTDSRRQGVPASVPHTLKLYDGELHYDLRGETLEELFVAVQVAERCQLATFVVPFESIQFCTDSQPPLSPSKGG